MGDEVLDGSTEAKETRCEQPARGAATERYASVPTARRSAAAVQQEAENSASGTDSRAQDPIERTLRRLVSLGIHTQKVEKNKNSVGQNAVIGAFEVHKVRRPETP